MLSVDVYKTLGENSHGAARGDSAAVPTHGAFVLDVQFDVPAGVTILFGASGSGKSTTLKSIAGLARPDRGRVTCGGRVIFDSEQNIDLPARAREVGYVFQNLALFPHLSALENVGFALNGLPRREREERARTLLESFGVARLADRRPRDISGGEAQRVALARALAARPRLLLLDEPLSALDDATKFSIIDDLKKFNRAQEIPVIYVTHSREEALALGERVVVLERGRVVAQGEPLEVFGAPVRTSVALLTGVENLFVCRVVSRNVAAGTMTVEVKRADGGGACRLEVPLGDYRDGDWVRVAVRSGDILLATEEPRSTSARNVLRGRVSAIEHKSDHAEVTVSSGVEWAVRVTRQAVADLKLTEGAEVWMAIKTFSCHFLDE